MATQQHSKQKSVVLKPCPFLAIEDAIAKARAREVLRMSEQKARLQWIARETELLNALDLLKRHYRTVKNPKGMCLLFRAGHHITNQLRAMESTSSVGLQQFFRSFDAADMCACLLANWDDEVTA